MFNIQIELLENETIEFSKAANHFMGLEGVGGKLFITNKRVVFKSHTLNFQVQELTINYSDIVRVEFYNNLGIVPNGLRIILDSGKTEKFVVWKRKTIKSLIEGKLSSSEI